MSISFLKSTAGGEGTGFDPEFISRHCFAQVAVSRMIARVGFVIPLYCKETSLPTGMARPIESREPTPTEFVSDCVRAAHDEQTANKSTMHCHTCSRSKPLIFMACPC